MIKKHFIVLILLVLSLSGCSITSQKKHIENILQTNLDNCKITYKKDTHGGFLGDGTYLAKLSCKNIDSKILESNWNSLPLSKEINEALTMKQCDDQACKDIFERYNIPNITNGYYYFYDRHSSSTNRKYDGTLNLRPSYNFSIGIYDTDNSILYFYELDT